jgi:threonyl-tRNA synthetase
VQVAVLPVADRHDAYAREVTDRLRAAGARVELDDAQTEKLGKRIFRAKADKIPYVLVVGDDDVDGGTVGVNRRGSDEPERGVALDGFLAELQTELAPKH